MYVCMYVCMCVCATRMKRYHWAIVMVYSPFHEWNNWSNAIHLLLYDSSIGRWFEIDQSSYRNKKLVQYSFVCIYVYIYIFNNETLYSEFLLISPSPGQYKYMYIKSMIIAIKTRQILHIYTPPYMYMNIHKKTSYIHTH